MTKDQILAFMRHIYTAVGIAGSVLLALGMLTQEQVDKIMAAIKTIGENAGAIATAVGVLVGVWNAYRASRSASPAQQISKVDKIDGVEVKVDPLAAPPAAIAAAIDPALPNVTLKEP